MRPILYHILFVAVVLLCTACDSDNLWFYRPVAFEGEVKQPELVVTGVLQAGESPKIYVNRSRFFQDPTIWDTVWVPYSGPYEDGYYTRYKNPLFVKDAVVEMQINGGEWVSLSCEEEDYIYTATWEPMSSITYYYYTQDRHLQEGDNVNIRVRHDNFEHEATTSQNIPYLPDASVSNLSYNNQDRTLSFDITLPAYTGNSDHLFRVSTTSYSHNIFTITDDWQGTATSDTTYYTLSMIFSQDARFAEYNTINQPLSQGYFGSDGLGLYVPSPTSETTFSMKAATADYNHYLDSLVIQLDMVTQDEYLTVSSLLAGGYVYQYVRDYFYDPESDIDDMGDFIEIIQELFDEMGNMEGTQVYCNIDGGMGHVTSLARQEFVVYFTYTQSKQQVISITDRNLTY